MRSMGTEVLPPVRSRRAVDLAVEGHEATDRKIRPFGYPSSEEIARAVARGERSA